MTRKTVTFALLAALGAGLSGTAFAADASYPRFIGGGENSMIDYGPGPRGNIVGGGALNAGGSGENNFIMHLDPSFAQMARQGLVPLAVGSGEGQTIVWVPAGLTAAQRALVGADGSVPGLRG